MNRIKPIILNVLGGCAAMNPGADYVQPLVQSPLAPEQRSWTGILQKGNMSTKKIISYFTLENNANWECPTCGRTLFLIKDTLKEFESSATQKISGKSYSHQMEFSLVFSCVFKCVNNKCNEYVACTGESFHDVDIKEDPYGNAEQIYPKYYKPKYFYPNIELFKIPTSVPEKISKSIQKSFEMFFCNHYAALNEIRSAVERLLEFWGLSSTNANGKFIPLNNRIDNIPSSHEKYKDHLMAAKWLGNAGSHMGTEIKEKDIIDAYELISYVLNEVFESDHHRISSISNAININKGPR